MPTDRAAQLRAAARGRLPHLIEAYGGRVQAPAHADHGRATCPVHRGDGFNLQYSAEIATCWTGCGGRTFDAIALVAACEGLPTSGPDFPRVLDRLESALGALPPAPPLPPPSAMGPPTDPAPIWTAARLTDAAAEAYLESRGLSYRDPELLRFAVEHPRFTWWTRKRIAAGYRVALAMRDAAGSLRDLTLRFVGSPPEGGQKTLALPGVRTAGLAFSRPRPDSPEVVLVEGATDTLAACELWPDADVLGVPGAGNARKTVESFAARIRGQRCVVALDSDTAGNAAADAAVSAAWSAGAAEVVRRVPEIGKDIAEELAASKVAR